MWSMKGLLGGFASLWFLAGTALAQPMQLTAAQMDKVTAGHLEIDVSNTSVTVLSIFQRPYLMESTPNAIICPSCFLLIVSPAISVASQFGL